jgi:hypothetical protein
MIECSICLGTIDIRECDEMYACEHVFHELCVSKWKGNCPNCRAPRKKINLINIKRPSGLDIAPYLRYGFVKKCHDNLHALYAFQMSTPPYGCCVTCRSCNRCHFVNIL